MSEEDQPDTTPDLRDLITLKQAAELVDLSYSHLRYLARRGEIWVVRLGPSWLTTASAVRDYASRVHKPGPKLGSKKRQSP